MNTAEHSERNIMPKTKESPDRSDENERPGKRVLKHLMNGVSHMLPFSIAGGLFIAIAFLIDTIADAPHDSSFGTFTAAARFFKTMGGYTFDFMMPVLAGYIAKSIADRPGFLVGMAGGFLAVKGSTFADVTEGIPSGFLGALLAGFAGGLLMLGIEKLCAKMPSVFDGIKPTLFYPLLGLGTIAVFMCAANPFMGMINTGLSALLSSMAGSGKIVLGCVLGAMMAVDVGGPINKTAYLFGTAALASGDFDVMAAVMIGGMTPPLAIALSVTFFKSRWTAEERKNGYLNYIMGLSFVTESAIPFAASDPLRVIPAITIGSAVSGGLSMLFRCTLMAPHGGVFVFPIVGNPWMYALSLASGSLVGMVTLALFKKRRTADVRE